MTGLARKALLSLGLLAVAGAPALAQAPAQPRNPAVACGGDLATFLAGIKAEAIAKGIPADAAERALAGAAIDQKVLSRDRAQGVFKQTFTEFSKRTVSKSRLDIGDRKSVV